MKWQPGHLVFSNPFKMASSLNFIPFSRKISNAVIAKPEFSNWYSLRPLRRGERYLNFEGSAIAHSSTRGFERSAHTTNTQTRQSKSTKKIQKYYCHLSKVFDIFRSLISKKTKCLKNDIVRKETHETRERTKFTLLI